jgi:hypothetical protein
VSSYLTYPVSTHKIGFYRIREHGFLNLLFHLISTSPESLYKRVRSSIRHRTMISVRLFYSIQVLWALRPAHVALIHVTLIPLNGLGFQLDQYGIQSLLPLAATAASCHHRRPTFQPLVRAPWPTDLHLHLHPLPLLTPPRLFLAATPPLQPSRLALPGMGCHPPCKPSPPTRALLGCFSLACPPPPPHVGVWSALATLPLAYAPPAKARAYLLLSLSWGVILEPSPTHRCCGGSLHLGHGDTTLIAANAIVAVAQERNHVAPSPGSTNTPRRMPSPSSWLRLSGICLALPTWILPGAPSRQPSPQATRSS